MTKKRQRLQGRYMGLLRHCPAGWKRPVKNAYRRGGGPEAGIAAIAKMRAARSDKNLRWTLAAMRRYYGLLFRKLVEQEPVLLERFVK